MADAPLVGDLEGRLELAYAKANADAIRQIADEADALAMTEPALRPIAQTARFYLDRLDSPPPRAKTTPPTPAVRPPLSRGMRAWIALCSSILGAGAAVSLIAGIVLAVATYDRFGAAAFAYVLYGVIVAAVLVALVLVLKLLRLTYDRPPE